MQIAVERKRRRLKITVPLKGGAKGWCCVILPAVSENSPPVKVENRIVAADTQHWGRDINLEAALARSSFQERCSRCPLRQGFQGHQGLSITSSLTLMPYSPYQSVTSLPNKSEAQHIGLLLTIHLKVVGAARMFRFFCFLLLSFLFLLFHTLYGSRDLVCPVSSSILSVQHRVRAK